MASWRSLVYSGGHRYCLRKIPRSVLSFFRCCTTPGSYPHKQFIGKLDRGYFEAKIEFSLSWAFVSNGDNSYTSILLLHGSHKCRVVKDHARSETISTKPERGVRTVSCWDCDRHGRDIGPSHNGLPSAHSVPPPRGLWQGFSLFRRLSYAILLIISSRDDLFAPPWIVCGKSEKAG